MKKHTAKEQELADNARLLREWRNCRKFIGCDIAVAPIPHPRRSAAGEESARVMQRLSASRTEAA